MIDNKQAIVILANKGFQILDLTTLTLGRRIKPGGKRCYAVTCSNNQIWTSNGGTTISQIDISGNILHSITTKNEIQNFCIDNDRNIYYTSRGIENNVYRITLDGQDSIFCSHSDLIYSRGIDVDSKGNVYVGGMLSHNIHRISSDGKNHQIILTKNDGIKCPWGFCYNRETKQFLVANDHTESVAIYSLH
ncbi:unnamed protein product [Mytilus coruscus]|uniref:Uncharacterized protein n=1 Tax=Mytilus coruscus TaxID=42192 RepID=A0A6J8A4A6_MYTCO|nr:unnamed protein product [Mytilus coruscus]